MEELAERVAREKAAYDHGTIHAESSKLHRRFRHVFECPNSQGAERYLDQIEMCIRDSRQHRAAAFHSSGGCGQRALSRNLHHQFAEHAGERDFRFGRSVGAGIVAAHSGKA